MFYTFCSNSLNFWFLGHFKGPQLRFLIDNQFWKFIFWKKNIFDLKNRGQSGSRWKFEKKMVKNGFALYMAYLVPRNHFKDTKLMVFYWTSMGHIDNWSKNNFSHKKYKKSRGGPLKPIKNNKKFLQSYFLHNSVNFWLSGCSKSPQLRVLIDNQFCNFSFCEKFILSYQNRDQSRTN